MSAYDLVNKALASGLSVVQIADNLPVESFSAEQLHALHAYAENHHVAIEMGSRGLTPDHTYLCLKAAQALHSPILRMVIDSKNYEPDLQSVIGIISDLVPDLISSKISLAIENHDRFKAREFENIIQSVGSEFVGICLDSVNSMGAGEGFNEVSGILIPYTINLHVKDFTIRRVAHKMGIIIEGAPAGSGMLNIAELIKILTEKGRCQSAILELWTPPEETIENTIRKEEAWALESIKYLKGIVT
jgi:sugar phosphate isomerase/epimerase